MNKVRAAIAAVAVLGAAFFFVVRQPKDARRDERGPEMPATSAPASPPAPVAKPEPRATTPGEPRPAPAAVK